MRESGIEIMVQWGGKGVHEFEALGLTHFDLPRTDRLFERTLLLPMHTEISDDQVEYVTDIVRGFYVR